MNIKSCLIVLCLFTVFFSLKAQNDGCGSLAQAEGHMKEGKFALAIDELLRVRLCAGISPLKVRAANGKILEYAKNMEEAKKKLADKEKELNAINIALKEAKNQADTNLALSEKYAANMVKAAETATAAERLAADAKRNFYNGLIILFNYISSTGHSQNFTEWASESSYVDSLRGVLEMMIDNSEKIGRNGPNEKAKWKASLQRMNPDQMTELFSLLGGESTIMVEDTLDEGQTWKDILAYIGNNEYGLALELLFLLESKNKSLPIYESMVNCFIKLNKFDDALKYANEMYKLRPNALPALIALRTAHSKKGNFRNAEYYAKRVIDAKGQSANSLDFSNLSFYQIFTSDYEGALASTELALAKEEKNWIKVNKAHALLFGGKKDEAIALYSQLKGLPDDSPTGTGSLKKALIDDLNTFEAAGIKRVEFKDVRRLLDDK